MTCHRQLEYSNWMRYRERERCVGVWSKKRVIKGNGLGSSLGLVKTNQFPKRKCHCLMCVQRDEESSVISQCYRVFISRVFLKPFNYLFKNV